MRAAKIIRVFPRRTNLTPRDELAFVGDPPMMRPEADEVHVSTVFTWDKERVQELAKAWGQYYPVKLGGPAFDDPSDGFTPGLYVKQGVTFTTRGCNNQCPFCLVPKREGRLRETNDFAVGNILNDNNLLQADQRHLDRVFTMLKTQRQIEFSGGIDSRLVTDSISETIRGLRLYQIFLACDYKEAIRPLRRAIQKLQLPRQKVRCYVLIAYRGETLSEATGRLIEVWEAGAMPFAQLYQPPDKWIEYSHEWRALARTWSRPAAMKAMMKERE